MPDLIIGYRGYARRSFSYQGYWAVLELPTCKALRVYVAHFLNLYRGFQGHRVIERPSDYVDVRLVLDFLRELLYVVLIPWIEHVVHSGGRLHEKALAFLKLPGGGISKERDKGELGGRGFCGGDCLLRAGVYQEGVVRGPVKGGAHDVHERDDLRPFPLCHFHRFQHVSCLPALRDCYHERLRLEEVVIIGEL